MLTCYLPRTDSCDAGVFLKQDGGDGGGGMKLSVAAFTVFAGAAAELNLVTACGNSRGSVLPPGLTAR